MNGSLGESRKLVDALRTGVGSAAGADMLLAPPYVIGNVKDVST